MQLPDLDKAGAFLREGADFLLTSHVNSDGDGIGGCLAVQRLLRQMGKSAVVIMGGGSPKNFLLQTEPQLQEVLGLDEAGHDYFVQVTDARPDTGGLSGATPSEAVSWGKVDPGALAGKGSITEAESGEENLTEDQKRQRRLAGVEG